MSFKPEAHRLLLVYLSFPVENAELVLHDIEDRRGLDHAELTDKLQDAIEARLKPLGACIQEAFTYGDISYRVECGEAAEADILRAVEDATRKFWFQRMARAPEVAQPVNNTKGT